MRYIVGTYFDPENQLHAFRAMPEVVGRVDPFESPAKYPSGTEALIAALRYLEGMGVTNIQWQAVAACLWHRKIHHGQCQIPLVKARCRGDAGSSLVEHCAGGELHVRQRGARVFNAAQPSWA